VPLPEGTKVWEHDLNGIANAPILGSMDYSIAAAVAQAVAKDGKDGGILCFGPSRGDAQVNVFGRGANPFANNHFHAQTGDAATPEIPDSETHGHFFRKTLEECVNALDQQAGPSHASGIRAPYVIQVKVLEQLHRRVRDLVGAAQGLRQGVGNDDVDESYDSASEGPSPPPSSAATGGGKSSDASARDRTRSKPKSNKPRHRGKSKHSRIHSKRKRAVSTDESAGSSSGSDEDERSQASDSGVALLPSNFADHCVLRAPGKPAMKLAVAQKHAQGIIVARHSLSRAVEQVQAALAQRLVLRFKDSSGKSQYRIAPTDVVVDIKIVVGNNPSIGSMPDDPQVRHLRYFVLGSNPPDSIEVPDSVKPMVRQHTATMNGLLRIRRKVLEGGRVDDLSRRSTSGCSGLATACHSINGVAIAHCTVSPDIGMETEVKECLKVAGTYASASAARPKAIPEHHAYLDAVMDEERRRHMHDRGETEDDRVKTLAGKGFRGMPLTRTGSQMLQNDEGLFPSSSLHPGYSDIAAQATGDMFASDSLFDSVQSIGGQPIASGAATRISTSSKVTPIVPKPKS